MLVAIGLFAIRKVAMCPDCVWMNIFHCFVFGIIAISTARVNYVCHKKITAEMQLLIDSDVSPVRVLSQPIIFYMISPQLKKY